MARILVVDDDDEHRLLVCTLLGAEGHETHHCGDPLKAASLIEQLKPDLAILDYQMPGLSGVQLLDQLRRLDSARRLPVILLSAIDTIRYSGQVAPNPHTRFLQKPIDGKRLFTAVFDLLNGWSDPS